MKVGLVIFTSCLAFAPQFGWAQSAAPVKIDVGVQRGSTMPDLLRAGVFTFRSDPPNYPLTQWLTETRPGVVEIDIGGSVFQLAEDADDAMRRMRRMLPLLQRIRAAGGEPVLAITRIPTWLSSRPRDTDPVKGDVVPKANIVAPRDGKEWSALVTRVITAVKDEAGRTPDIKIGWEPDQSAWQGSEKDYFDFYRDTASGVKRADPAARVGGPSVSALYNGKSGDSAPMLPRFLQYCAATPIPELGMKRLPVDFLIWHQFGTDAVLAWDLAAHQARAWLRQAGYPEDTELFIGEWSSWLGWPNPQSAELDQPALAAYVVASLAAMEHAGIRRAAFTSLLEQRQVEDQSFIGSFGLFTNQFIKKPSYWAFTAIGRLGATRLAARSSDPLVSVIAGRPSRSELAVVVADSTPDDRAIMRSFVAKVLASGVTFDQVRRELDERQLGRLLSGDTKLADLRLSDHMRLTLSDALADVSPLVQGSRAVRGKPRRISIELSSLDLVPGNVEIWRIDNQHANAQLLRGRIDSYLKQRLTQEKENLGPGLVRRLHERGFQAEQIETFKQVMNARSRDAALNSFPQSEKAAIRAMVDEAQTYIDERLSQVGEEINAWPELAFKPDAEAPRRNGRVIEFDMEGDSVVLLRFTSALR